MEYADVIVITSEEEDEQVRQRLHELGYTWTTGKPFTEMGCFNCYGGKDAYIRPTAGTRGCVSDIEDSPDNQIKARDFLAQFSGFDCEV